MAKFRSPRNSFLGGEISATAMGRTDLPMYQHACAQLRNMLPFLSGGVYRRPGTLNETTFPAATYLAPLLVPFYSDTFDTFTTNKHSYCHALLNKIASAPFAMASFSPNADNKTANGAAAVTAAGPVGLQVRLDPADTTTKRTDLFYDPLLATQSAQSGDVRYLACETALPQKIARVPSAIDGSGHYTTGAFTLKDFNGDVSQITAVGRESWPFLSQNTDTGIFMYVADLDGDAGGGPGDTTTLWASSSGGGQVDVSFFNTGHVGTVFKIHSGAEWGVGLVTAWVSATKVTIKIIVNFGTEGAATGVNTWWEGAWSTYRGFPRAVAFFQDRLVFGGTRSQPDSLWFSALKNYTVFSVKDGVDAYAPSSDTTVAFTVDVPTRDFASIQSLNAKESLFINTRTAEYTLDVDPTTNTFSHSAFAFIRQNNFGAAHVQSVRTQNELLFVSQDGRSIIALAFNFGEQAYIAENIQVLFDEYPRVPLGSTGPGRSIRQIAWDQSRSTLWCIDTGGNLFAVTRDRNKGITTWSSHQIGGYVATTLGASVNYDGASGNTSDPIYIAPTGSVVSICTVKNPSNEMDDLWMCVKRKVNGAWQYFFDRMIGEHIREETAYGVQAIPYYYLDSSSVGGLTGGSGALLGSLTQYVGETLSGNAFNSYGIFPFTTDAVGAGFTATIQSPVPPHIVSDATTSMRVGYNFSSIVAPVRIEAGSQVGSSQSAHKRIHQVALRFYKTLSCKIGADSGSVVPITFRDPTAAIGKSADLFTGDKIIKIMGTPVAGAGSGRDAYVYVLQDQPLPFALISIIAEGDTYDG